jgi:2,3-bisphosphoglycerate-independent phosphoglycerate mutase
MNTHDLIRELRADNSSKIVLVAVDGLGGLPLEPGGRTELETARKPHLDALARQGVCGLSVPVLPGVTPSEHVGHLALFGYDPLRMRIAKAEPQDHAQGVEQVPRDGSTPSSIAPLTAFEPIREVYGVQGLVVGSSPAIRGAAHLMGLDVLDGLDGLDEKAGALRRAWGNYDFFVLHFHDADDAGRAGNFDAKVKALEHLDTVLPRVLSLGPDVLAVAGAHSTPTKLRGPSWHPVPALLWAKTCRPDAVREFGESACLLGGLGTFPATQFMGILLAHARRLSAFGAY